MTSGYSVPWARKSMSPSLRASVSNTSMKVRPMLRRFSSGSVTPGERAQESIGGVDVHQVDVALVAHHLDDALALGAAQQAVVDEDARQLVADRLVRRASRPPRSRRRR